MPAPLPFVLTLLLSAPVAPGEMATGSPAVDRADVPSVARADVPSVARADAGHTVDPPKPASPEGIPAPPPDASTPPPDASEVKPRARPAPEEDNPPPLIEAIEVTATQSERPVDESPVPVLVLRAHDLERTGTLDLSQALSSAPGVTVSISENSARGGGPGVSIQGLEGKQVLVLLNGRPFVGDSDGVVDVTAIPVSVLERIEVVAGPMAVMYGGGAIGGVINLITKIAPPGSGGPHLASNARYSNYNTLDTSQALSYGASTMSAFLVGNYGASDGFDNDPTYLDTDGERYRRSNLWGSFAWRPRPNLDVRLDTLYGTSDRLRIYADNELATLGRIYYNDWAWNERRLFSTLSLEWTRSQFQLSSWISTSLYQRDYSETVEGGLKATYRDTEAAEVNGRVQGTWLPSARTFVMAGIEARHQALDIETTEVDAEGVETGPTPEVDQGQLTMAEAFALADHTFFGDRLEVYGGLRLNYTTHFGFYPPSVLNLRWRVFPELTLRGNFGLGYRAPNLKELNYQFDHSAYGYKILGNPDLEPERSFTSNLSAELERSDIGLLRAGYFFNDVHQMIDYQQISAEGDDAGLLLFQLENIAAVVTQGLEAIGSTRLGPVELTAAWQYLDARDKYTGLHLLYRSAQTAKLNASWRLGDSGAELSGVARYQGPQFVSVDGELEDPTSCLGGYEEALSGSSWNASAISEAEDACYTRVAGFVVLDARAQARFQLPGGPLTLVFYGGVNNILNVRRDPQSLTTANDDANQTLDVRPLQGRAVFIGLKGEI